MDRFRCPTNALKGEHNALANNARRVRSLHLEAVLDDAGCEPKATITHLYVQSIRVTNVETVGVLLRLQSSARHIETKRHRQRAVLTRRQTSCGVALVTAYVETLKALRRLPVSIVHGGHFPSFG